MLADVIRRFLWRMGRAQYMWARSEEAIGDISQNGEALVQSCIISVVPRDEKLVVFDIGANQGEWTESFLKLLPEERLSGDAVALHAFEPIPATVELFRKRLRRLEGSELVYVHQLAMSDERGGSEIGVFNVGGGTNSLHYQGDPRPCQQIIQIVTEKLDDFCEHRSIERIHLVKCDTEGHDAKVLVGAMRLLAEERIDVIQFEYNHRWIYSRTFLKDVFDLVERTPYKVARVTKTGLTVYSQWHPELDRFFQCNYLVLHDRILDGFNVHYANIDSSNTYV